MTSSQIWRAVVFALGTVGLIYVSRRSLTRPRSHGFYRFFAWEFILALFLLNIPHWFRAWLAWHQVISWMLLIVCIIPLVYGVQALRKRGSPDTAQRTEPELLAFERTTTLVTDGIYRYIRHPLYSSLFLLTWGILFKDPSWLGLALAAAASAFLVATARADEAECLDCFGTEYRQYMQHTRMFIPYFF
jgi:protein-S-isoprenylcysteine O-methyltransferase Ste14